MQQVKLLPYPERFTLNQAILFKRITGEVAIPTNWLYNATLCPECKSTVPNERVPEDWKTRNKPSRLYARGIMSLHSIRCPLYARETLPRRIVGHAENVEWFLRRVIANGWTILRVILVSQVAGFSALVARKKGGKNGQDGNAES